MTGEHYDGWFKRSSSTDNGMSRVYDPKIIVEMCWGVRDKEKGACSAVFFLKEDGGSDEQMVDGLSLLMPDVQVRQNQPKLYELLADKLLFWYYYFNILLINALSQSTRTNALGFWWTGG